MRVLLLLLLCATAMSSTRHVHLVDTLQSCTTPSTATLLERALDKDVLWNTAYEWGEHHQISEWTYKTLSDAEARGLEVAKNNEGVFSASAIECIRLNYAVQVHMPTFAAKYLSMVSKPVSIRKQLCAADGKLYERVEIEGLPLISASVVSASAKFWPGKVEFTTDTDVTMPVWLSFTDYFSKCVGKLMQERWHQKSTAYVKYMCA